MSDDQTMYDHDDGFQRYRNWHHTVHADVDGLTTIHQPPGAPPFDHDFMRRCVHQIQRAIAQAVAEDLDEVRVTGRRWSLSDVNVPHDGRMIDIGYLTRRRSVRDHELHAGYPESRDLKRLWLVQGGAQLSVINERLESDSHQRSLHTMGAANGQTFAGATGTGTHGSALGFGSLHDHIQALHLVVGPNRHIWLERADRPVMTDQWVADLGAELMRDNDAFAAAQMGLGSFGVVHAAVIATRPRYLLRAENKAFYDTPRADGSKDPFVFNDAMRAVIGGLDFSAVPELATPAGQSDPYFFQAILDPNSQKGDDPRTVEVLTTQMYEEPWDDDHELEHDEYKVQFGPGYDILSTVGLVLDLLPGLAGVFSKWVRDEEFKLGTKTGTLGEQFGFKTEMTKVASGTVAVPLSRAVDALDTLLALNRSAGPAPLVYGCRYLRPGDALMSFARWDPSFVISIDGVWNRTSKAFFKAIPDAMDANSIPFTQHWGKTNHMTEARITAQYGDRVTRFKAARERVFDDPALKRLFENDYMRERGLV